MFYKRQNNLYAFIKTLSSLHSYYTSTKCSIDPVFEAFLVRYFLPLLYLVILLYLMDAHQFGSCPIISKENPAHNYLDNSAFIVRTVETNKKAHDDCYFVSTEISFSFFLCQNAVELSSVQ